MFGEVQFLNRRPLNSKGKGDRRGGNGHVGNYPSAARMSGGGEVHPAEWCKSSEPGLGFHNARWTYDGIHKESFLPN